MLHPVEIYSETIMVRTYQTILQEVEQMNGYSQLLRINPIGIFFTCTTLRANDLRNIIGMRLGN